MALQSVTITGDQVSPTTIKMHNPDQTGFVLDTEIEGLGAGKADIHTTPYALLPGSAMNGSRRPERNIVFNLAYGDLLDPEQGREISYDLFQLESTRRFIFQTGIREMYIDGVIESNEPNIFTQEPSFQISVICPFPYFRSMEKDQIHQDFYSLKKEFEFPFSNESTTEKLIVLGEYTNQSMQIIFYPGNVSIGMTIRLSFTGPVTHPSILYERDQTHMRIDTGLLTSIVGSGIKAGDIIEIVTVRGQKSVTLIRENKHYNVLNALSRTSSWLMLKKGENPISIHADTGLSNMQVDIYSDVLYSGI